MCFLPYPSIPSPFSHYSAWIPLERSFGYSYSFKSIGVDRATFGVILFQYSPTFLALLSVDTARGFTLLLLLIFSSLFSLSFFLFSLFLSFFFFYLLSFLFFFLFLFFFYFYFEHWSKLKFLALLQLSSQYSLAFPILLSMDTVKDIVLLLKLSIGVDWMHIYYSKRLK